MARNRMEFKKIDIFQELFNKNIDIIKNCNNALCLGSRTGQEVIALKNMGVGDVIGIDICDFPPLTIKGDIHDLEYDDNTFDLEFSNIFDHSLYPDKFISEVERTLKLNGHFILHLQIDVAQDKYTEINIKNIERVKQLFKKSILVKEDKIESGPIAMNYELIYKKTKLYI